MLGVLDIARKTTLTCAGVGVLCGHLNVFAPLVFDVLLLVAGWATSKDARRAAYVSMPSTVAMVFGGMCRIAITTSRASK